MTSASPPWYDEAFGALYRRVYAHRDDAAAAREASFAATSCGWTPGHRVLDLACGTGRHAGALAARGLRVVGLDRSRPLLAEARRRPGIQVLRGDLRSLPVADAACEGVGSFFTSFGYFESEAEDRQVLAEVSRVLARGRRFFFDFLDAATVRAKLVPESRREQDGLVVEERRRIERDRIRKRVRIAADGAPPLEYEESVRLYERGELEAMLRAARLEVVASFGDFDGRSAGAGPRLILVAERAA